MQDRHEPSDRFVERLGQDIGAEVRRRNLQPPLAPWWRAAGLKTVAAAAALVVVSMAVGGAVVAASYQNENREQREMLAGLYERKIQLAQLKLDAAKQQMQDVERRIAVGVVGQDAALEARQGVAEGEAQLRIAMLNLEEVRLTSREPRDEVSAPPVPGRDFVRERLDASLAIPNAALTTEKQKLQTVERRVSLGLAQRGEVEVHRTRIVELESAIQAVRRKIDARRVFIETKDSTLADLRMAEIAAEQRFATLKPQYDLALGEKERIALLVGKGLASPVEVTRANVRALELLTELQRAEYEIAMARQRIAERTAGKGGGS